MTGAARACISSGMRLSTAALLVSLAACASREIPAPVPLAQKAAAPQGRSPPEARRAAPAVGDARCTADADCTLTRIPAGGCCASLCEPRAVTAREAAALNAAGAACRCAEPQCAPERMQVVPFCQAGSCASRQESMQ